MKKTLWPLVLALSLALVHHTADAKRLGGGGALGKRSGNVTQREAARQPQQNPQQPQNAGQQNAAAQQGGKAAAAQASRPWGSMLGGLAAGMGLAWLAQHLGLGAEFGQFLLLGLLAAAIMAAVGWMRRRANAPARAASPLAFQGAGSGNQDSASHKIGNDASARPWEYSGGSHFSGHGGAGSSAPGVRIGVALAGNTSPASTTLGGTQNWGIPEGFDAAGFLAAARRNFTALQAAWDQADLSVLRAMMTDAMLTEVREQLQARGAAPNQTDVVALDAQLLGIEEQAGEYIASVEFSGMIREDAATGPRPFREVWNMSKAKNGGGWLVAGLQAFE